MLQQAVGLGVIGRLAGGVDEPVPWAQATPADPSSITAARMVPRTGYRFQGL